MKIHPDLRRHYKAARKAGYTIEQTRSGHIRWTRPDGAYITASFSSSDRNGPRNTIRDLERRLGLRVV